jgi:hypothetical protein
MGKLAENGCYRIEPSQRKVTGVSWVWTMPKESRDDPEWLG